MSEVVQTNNSVVSSGEAIKNLKETLKGFKVNTKVDAVKMLAFLSVVTNDTTVKALKEKCYSFLQDRCSDCLNAVDPESGIEVTKVEKHTPVYNQSEEVDKINAQMEKLKVKLKAAQEKAGVQFTKESSYYKVKM